MTDRGKTIKGLEYHLKELSVGKTCYECPYFGDNPCEIQLIANTLELLKEQKAEIERLKKPDCEHAEHDGAGCLGYSGCHQDDEPIDACKGCMEYTGNQSGDGEANA